MEPADIPDLIFSNLAEAESWARDVLTQDSAGPGDRAEAFWILGKTL